MTERPGAPPPRGTSRRFEGSARAVSNGILLLVATGTLAFLAWNAVLHGIGIGEDPAFRTWAARLFLLLGFALALSLLPDAGTLWREGLKRQELPPVASTSSYRERSFRTTGSALPLIRHCSGEMDRHFRRYYAFHHYEAPYVAYFFYAKKGPSSLLGLPCAKAGFLLLFLVAAPFVERG